MEKIQYQVSGRSMEPTLYDGDVVELVSQEWRDGDIVVAVQDGKKIVKRVVRGWLIGDNKGVSSVHPLHEVTILGVVNKTLLSGDNGYLAKVEAATKSTTFAESTSRSQTQTITIPNLKSVSNVTVNTGNVSYSVSGDTITFNLSNGAVSRTVQTGGTYTPPDTIWVTGQSSPNYNSGGYTGTLAQYVESGSYTPADTKSVTRRLGNYTKQELLPASTFYNSGGYVGTVYMVSSWFDPSDGYWHADYTGTATRPESDTRVYKYQGNVTKSASDTRTYAYYYQYTTTVNYSDNSSPNVAVSTSDNQTLSAVTGRRTITISGTVTDADNNTVIVSATINGKTKSTSVANTSTTKTWSLTWDVVTDSIEQGTYSNIAVFANDGNGGSSTATYTGTITVDKTNPVITIAGVTSGTTYQNSVTPTFSATDAGGSALSTTTATLNGSVYTSGTVINTSGAKTLIVTATDNAGNQSQQTVNFSINKGPMLTLTNPPTNSTLFEGNTFQIEGSTSDTDTGNVVTIKYKLNNGTTRALNSGVSNGSTPISFAKSLAYSKKRLWDGATDVVGADLAENTSHTLTVWTEDDQGGVSNQITRTFSVVWNRPPVISGTDKNLGAISTIPTFDYSATDPEGNTFTFAEYLNGQQIISFAGVVGQKYTATIDNDNWLRMELDSPHELKVRATDSEGLFSDRVYTFTRTESKIEFELNFNNPKTLNHFTCDAKPSRILVTLDSVIPSGASIEKVEVCNNAFDAAPTWEDATGSVRAGRGYVFTNSSKTAANWGINIRVTIDKGTASERVILNGFGGAFD